MKKTIWILLDNRIGSRHQAEGIANYLDNTKFKIIFKEIEYTRWASLPNIIRGKTLIGITNTSKQQLTSPFPDFVLSATRRTAPVARWIKKQNPTTKLFQLLHIGKTGIKDFTTVFAPEHDSHKHKASNIHYTIGSPHFVTTEKLAQAREKWDPIFSSLPHPITAIIIGGSIKKHPFSLQNAENLATQIKQLKTQDKGSILLTTSRRTGAEAEKIIVENLKSIPQYAYLWGASGENPYLGFLSCADNIIVTGDSVSMCCEATAANKPLAIFTGKNWLTPKHLRFVQSLYEQNYAEPFSSQSFNTIKKTEKPLNIAQEIAEYLENIE
ncbi:MAG: mitochondrial fission ELM1 family protein [Acetobacter sp.]|nr:mitochondrial fission ELM1 family protein [Acetobacter sp.]